MSTLHHLNLDRDVLRGENGWLFLYQGKHKQFNYLLLEEEISRESIVNFKNNIVSRYSFCAEREIKYQHLVFPSKPLLKGQLLPNPVRKIDSLYDRYFGETENIYYPLDRLRDWVEPYQSTFQKLDTHMTDVAYESIVHHLLEFVHPNLGSQVEFARAIESVSGDLSKMLDRFDRAEELFLQIPKTFVYSEFNNFQALSGNSGRVKITHCFNPQTEYRLLIFGDSFFRQLTKLLTPFFRDVLYIRSPVFYREIVEMYAPDIIWTGNAERYLPSIPSDDRAQPFLLSKFFRKNYHPSSTFFKAFSAQLSYRHSRSRYEEWRSVQNPEAARDIPT